MSKIVKGSDKQASGSLGTMGVVSLDRPESEITTCNVEFGRYNPLGSSEVFNVPYKNKSNLDFFSRVNIAIEKTNFSGILPEKGPYVAVVLRVESNQIDKQKSNESWLERSQRGNNDSQGTLEDPLFSIRARIPELHAHLPIPKRYEFNYSSDSDTSQYDKLSKFASEASESSLVNMYPLFTCTPGANIQVPQVGSLVWVDFSDKFRTNGIYLGSLSSKTSPRTKKIYDQSSKSFDTGSKVDNQSLGNAKAAGQTNDPNPSDDTQVAKSQ